MTSPTHTSDIISTHRVGIMWSDLQVFSFYPSWISCVCPVHWRPLQLSAVYWQSVRCRPECDWGFAVTQTRVFYHLLRAHIHYKASNAIVWTHTTSLSIRAGLISGGPSVSVYSFCLSSEDTHTQISAGVHHSVTLKCLWHHSQVGWSLVQADQLATRLLPSGWVTAAGGSGAGPPGGGGIVPSLFRIILTQNIDENAALPWQQHHHAPSSSMMVLPESLGSFLHFSALVVADGALYVCVN